jgi:anthranilate phosphoribosyltransferase
MSTALTPEVARRELTREEVAAAINALFQQSVDDEAKAVFLRAWAQRGETASELAASAETLLPRAVDPGVRGSWNGQPLLDCCGTGGGGLNLLNISTGIVFILAAMGIPVVKHGNRGITKKSGSADVLEALGIRIDLQPDQVKACLEEVGAAFLYAPLYHTTFAAIAPVRQKLAAEGQRTIFNLLGPLLNPARPDARLVGVFKEEHLDLYQGALEKLGCPKFTVACGEDELSQKKIGEVSAKGLTRFGSSLRRRNGEPYFQIHAHLDRSKEGIASLLVNSAEESSQRLLSLLAKPDKSFAYSTLLINAGAAAWTHGTAPKLTTGYNLAQEALKSGRALAVLRKWQDFSAKL